MLVPLRQLLAGRPAPLCITPDVPIQEVLARMIENDYTQLPVVNQEGAYLGLISEQRLMRICFHLKKSNVFTALKVSQCYTPAEPLSPDADLFTALNRLEKAYAIVIVEEDKPVGILTDYDATHFFREIAEWLLIVRSIERTLRQYIECAFPEEQARKEGLIFAFGVGRKDEKEPAKQYEELTLHDHIQFMVTEQNWPKFQTCFESKAIFSGWMEQVNAIRNQLAHFREQVTKTQLDALQSALNWLNTCPKVPPVHEARLTSQDGQANFNLITDTGDVEGEL